MTGFNALQISFPRKEKPGGIGRRIRSNNGALSCILVGNVAAVIQGSVRVECQAICQVDIADEGRNRVDTGSAVGVGYTLQSGYYDACEDNEEGVDKRERRECNPIILKRMDRIHDMLEVTC